MLNIWNIIPVCKLIHGLYYVLFHLFLLQKKTDGETEGEEEGEVGPEEDVPPEEAEPPEAKMPTFSESVGNKA